jgi:hypothetical protein
MIAGSVHKKILLVKGSLKVWHVHG